MRNSFPGTCYRCGKADTERRRHVLAKGTGKSAQRARKYLREQYQDSTSG